MTLLDFVDLLRLRQWYKNVVVFLAIFFVGDLFNLHQLSLSGLAFLSLCLISSVGYIINDIADLKKDRLHPEKKIRALAAGRISVIMALLFAVIFFFFGFFVAYKINFWFVNMLVFFFVLELLYTFVFKKIIFADVIGISMLFVSRAVAGAVAIDVDVSPWLILCPFFLALFLAVGKRHSDLLLLGEKARNTRKVLADYSLELTNALMLMATTLLVISYAFYSFLSVHQNLMLSLPFALFAVFRYFSLVQSGSIIARHPEQVWKDKAMIVGILLWIFVMFLLLYLHF